MKRTFMLTILLCTSISLNAQVSNDLLLAYYPFSGNANDASGNGNHGTVNGAILTSDHYGLPDNAYNFTNGYIEVSGSVALNPTDISLCAWVKSEGSTGLNQFILNRENQYELYIDANNKLGWSLWGTGTSLWQYEPTGISLTSGVWSFIALTYDGVTVKIYLNGTLSFTKYYNQGKIVPRTGILRIGKRSFGSETPNIFNGCIDEVRLYGRVLSGAEVRGVYEGNLRAGLVGYYPFDGNANDISGKGNHGTKHGVVLASDRAGSNSCAYDFSNGYIEVGSSESLNPANISLCAWLNFRGSTNLNQFILNREDQFELYIDANNTLGWSLWGTGTGVWAYETTGIGLSPNVWSLVVLTYDGVTVKAYVNGELGYTRYYNQGNIVARDGALRIGKRSFGSEVPNIFNGRIDDVRIYDRTLSDAEVRLLYQVVTDVEEAEYQKTPVPERATLAQNYPNPFNPSTTIRYSLPHRSYVTLTVFNTLGQKVAELVNGDIEAGYHSIQFNASTLASGAYFYRMQAGSFVETKKLLLLR